MSEREAQATRTHRLIRVDHPKAGARAMLRRQERLACMAVCRCGESALCFDTPSARLWMGLHATHPDLSPAELATLHGHPTPAPVSTPPR